jgi:hypothetical protein
LETRGAQKALTQLKGSTMDHLKENKTNTNDILNIERKKNVAIRYFVLDKINISQSF